MKTRSPIFKNRHRINAAWGTWETLAFYKRNGYAESFQTTPEWIEKWISNISGEDAVSKMADAGINLIISRYFKGFGLKAEEPDLKYVREQIKWCRKYGITYLAYVQALTLVTETFFKEEPDAVNWIRRGPDGEMKYYEYTQTWRAEPAIYHRPFVDFLKKTITRAIAEDGADGIMLDNMNAHPCYCENCVREFRDYVRNSERYTPENMSVAFIDYDNIVIPRNLMERDPLAYEYMRFRHEKYRRVMKELHEAVKAARPDALFVPNSSSPCVTHENRLSIQKTNNEEMADCFDAMKNDGAGTPFMKEGKIASSIPVYKLSAALGTVIIPKNPLNGYQPDIKSDEEVYSKLTRAAAEPLAFGGFPLSFMGILNPTRTDRGSKVNLDYPSVRAPVAAYTGFVRDNDAIYSNAQCLADVFVYHSPINMKLRPALMKTLYSEVYQALLKDHVVFGVATRDMVEEMPVDTVLILQDIFAMSRDECDAILRFAGKGGRVIVIGPTSWFNEFGRDASQIGLAGLVDDNLLSDWEDGMRVISKNAFIEPTPTPDTMDILGVQRRSFDIARREELSLRSAISELAPNALKIDCDAPGHILVDAYRTTEGQTAVHLYNIMNETSCKGVILSIGNREETGEVRCLSPDDTEMRFKSWTSDGTLFVEIESLRTYAVVVVR